MLECCGPSNDRIYKVGVYFRNKLLGVGTGRSLQSAEKDAATKALETHQCKMFFFHFSSSTSQGSNFIAFCLLHPDEFKQLEFQREVIQKRYSEPYINKMLSRLQNFDPSFVEKFVEDKPADVDNSERSSKRRRIESTKDSEACSAHVSAESDMELDDDSL